MLRTWESRIQRFCNEQISTFFTDRQCSRMEMKDTKSRNNESFNIIEFLCFILWKDLLAQFLYEAFGFKNYEWMGIFNYFLTYSSLFLQWFRMKSKSNNFIIDFWNSLYSIEMVKTFFTNILSTFSIFSLFKLTDKEEWKREVSLDLMDLELIEASLQDI